MQIASATVDGNVVMLQEPAPKPGAAAETSLRATAGKAVYEGAGEWLHLTQNPRITDGGLEVSADKVDVSQASGTSFAHGNVKATWQDAGVSPGTGKDQKSDGVKESKAAGPARSGSVQSATLGGDGPAHAVAAEAQLHRDTGQATFQGKARLWQQGNSISAPVIVLDRKRQTLTAKTTSDSRACAGGSGECNGGNAGKASADKQWQSRPPVGYAGARRRSGVFERGTKAVMRAGAAGNVRRARGMRTRVRRGGIDSAAAG